MTATETFGPRGPRILVLGHGGHGKGTFCALLREATGLVSASSSEVAAPHILPALNAARRATGRLRYPNWEQAHASRAMHRELWKELIELYNTPDKTALAVELLQRANVYDGMRAASEYQATRHLFDITVWVDAKRRFSRPDPSLEIEQPREAFYVDNNEGLGKLREEVARFVEFLNWRAGRF